MARASGERGSAALEFALVLPVLLVVTLALVQVGILIRDQLVLTEAARAGAREAAVTASEDDVRTTVERAASILVPDRISISIQRDGGQGDPERVGLDYTAYPEIPFVRWLFPATIHLRADATMRQEYG